LRWRGERQSQNVDDRRGARPLVLGGGATLIVILIALLMGADPRALLQQIQTQSVPSEQTTPSTNAQADEQRSFVSTVLGSTEDVWREQFSAMGRTYREPTLVLFTEATESACGMAGAAVGPFYCSRDEKVYIDLGFYDLLQQRFGAPGDFAQAYVIAHEVGHHVQNLLGVSERVHELQQRSSKAEANELSVRLELQADFYAGVWAHHAQQLRQILEPGDLEEALNAASAIGDDRLQMEAQRRIVPDSFTHGTSEQRVRWFRLGWDTGDLSRGDTFAADPL
jgi:predicted metalloprotease